MKNILGIDIGYSNLKLAFGPTGNMPQTVLCPAGAAPADRFGARFDGQAHDDFIHVTVDGEAYVAGVSPDRAELWSRSLHADYCTGTSYRALFQAGLLLSGMKHIDTLVTGLPVSQHFDEARRGAVEKQMRGIHAIAPHHNVMVENVRVIPQPVGGLLDYIAQENVDLEDARVLVIDPGFFSVDWVVVAHKTLQRHSSGTSLNASSVVLEEACKQIGKELGAEVSTESLENAVRDSKDTVLVAGRRVQITSYIEKASKAIGHVIADSVHKALRTESQMVDLVVLVGGGAGFFREGIQEAFPRLEVVTPDEPVFSNTRGFWLMGSAQ